MSAEINLYPTPPHAGGALLPTIVEHGLHNSIIDWLSVRREQAQPPRGARYPPGTPPGDRTICHNWFFRALNDPAHESR